MDFSGKWSIARVVHIVGADLHGDHLVSLHVDGEVQLHVPPLLPVLSLDPAAGLLNLYAGGVDGYRDRLLGLLEATVGVDAEAEDPFPEVGVVAARALERYVK